MSERLRVTEVYAGGGVGGAIQHLMLLFGTLPREGLDLTVLSLPPHAAAEPALAAGLPVIRVADEAEAIRALGETPTDVVHTHGLRPTVIALRSSFHPWVRTVHSHLRTDYASFLKRLAATMAERRALRVADATIAVSHAVAGERRRLGAPEGRLVVIPNAVTPPPAGVSPSTLKERLAIPRSARLVLMLSRLQHVKGVDRAVAALAELPGEWHLVVFGEGPERDALTALAERAGTEGRLHLLPYEKDGRRYLEACDVVLIPSRDEGFSMVALEAQAAGAAVAASRTGGLPLALGDAAVFFDDASPRGVASAVLEADQMASDLGAKGRERWRELFRPEAFAARTAEVLRKAAGFPRSGSNYVS